MHPDSSPFQLPPPHGPSAPLRLSGPASLAAAVPYFLDCPAAGRAVLVLLAASGVPKFLASRGMPRCPTGASAEVLQNWADAVGREVHVTLHSIALQPGESIALVLYLPSAVGIPPEWFSSRLAGHFLPNTDVLDAVAVFDGRWRSLLCMSPTCCPPEGKRLADDPDVLLITAELVGAGLAALPDPPDPDVVADEVCRLLRAMPLPVTVRDRYTLLRRAWRASRKPAGTLQPVHLAHLAMAADRPGVRDALLTRLVKAEDTRWREQWQVWDQVAQSAPPTWRAGACCMAAVAAWALGDLRGCLLAVEAALDDEPGHRMAEYVRRLALRDYRAETWFERLSGIGEEECLAFDRPRAVARETQKAAG